MKFEPVFATIVMLTLVKKQAPEALGWEQESRRTRFDRLAGCSWLREAIAGGEFVTSIRERIESSTKAFLAERSRALLYEG
ncbi:MAG TPA: DUF1343 domain-containing protein, partial [Fimbriimonadaceae bacterium]|nr:DUF1343 domain-containing protein [Fimbriimonadaceae bacterium]